MAETTPFSIGAVAHCNDRICGRVTQVVLNQAAPLAPALVFPLRQLLAGSHVAVNLGQT